MVDRKLAGDIADLRYLDANNVRCPAGYLSDFRVCTEDSESLGSINGVLISPVTRRCEYFVIESKGFFSHKRFLLPVGAGASLEEPATLKINARKDELDLETFTPSSVAEFSDEDLITTIFSQDAA
jgi:PRC-barrel domain protein